MSRLRNFLKHHLNPVHVYCRLRDCRVPKPLARRLSAGWETLWRRPRLAALLALILLGPCALPAQARHLHKERVYQDIWCAKHHGQTEVRLRGGLRIDCLTDTHAVEADFAAKWAEAVGQCVAYANATGKRPGILLILERPSDKRHLAKLRRAIRGAKLGIRVWTITPRSVK